jgi:hypothetical protein
MTWHGTNCDVQTNENEIEFKAIQPSQERCEFLLSMERRWFDVAIKSWNIHNDMIALPIWFQIFWNEILMKHVLRGDKWSRRHQKANIEPMTFWECELCDKMLAPKNVMMRSWMKLLFLKTMSIEIFWNICM